MKVGDKVIISWINKKFINKMPLLVGNIGICYIIYSNGVFIKFDEISQFFYIDNEQNHTTKYITLNEYRKLKLERILK